MLSGLNAFQGECLSRMSSSYEVIKEYFSLPEPPTIHDTKFFPEKLVHEGTNEEFLCTASGLPTPEVKWITKDGIISEGPSLYLSDIKRQHGGNYICVAENSVGLTNRTISLVVSRKFFWFLLIVNIFCFPCISLQKNTTMIRKSIVIEKRLSTFEISNREYLGLTTQWTWSNNLS